MGEPKSQPREHWSPGDLAECVLTGPWYEHGLEPHGVGPRYGEVRIVAFVGAARCLVTGELVAVLRFERYGARLYSSRVFRKIVPRRDAERFDATVHQNLVTPAEVLASAPLEGS